MVCGISFAVVVYMACFRSGDGQLFLAIAVRKSLEREVKFNGSQGHDDREGGDCPA